MPGLAVQIPEHHRAGFVGVAFDPDLLHSRGDLLVRHARHGEPGHIALHVGEEHRHAQARKTLGHHHQRHRLAGAGGARHQSMPVAVLAEEMHRRVALAEEDVVHCVRLAWGSRDSRGVA
jgi:hypothetical protein